MVNNKFWRLAPSVAADPAAIIGESVLTSPPELIGKITRNDGIVVACWDSARDQGRVHALGIVQNVNKVTGAATVDWRRANFTVQPSPQGRSKWNNMTHFKFEPSVATRYRLIEYFDDAFSAGGGTVPGQKEEPDPPTSLQTEPSVQVRVTPQVNVCPPSSGGSSPQRNRVAPDGAIMATSARGTFMGNRAYGKRWLVCELEFERNLKEPRKYEKLFFLDEAVALAAGHRPCPTCRRHRYQAYVAAVQSSLPISGADELDAHLESARNAPPARAAISSLPDGAFAMFGADDHRLMWQGALHRWTPQGYVDPIALADIEDDDVIVLTPATSLVALRNGYRADVHASASRS